MQRWIYRLLRTAKWMVPIICSALFLPPRVYCLFVAIGKRHHRDLCVLFFCYSDGEHSFLQILFIRSDFFCLSYSVSRWCGNEKRNEHAQGAHTLGTRRDVNWSGSSINFIIICTEILSAIIIHAMLRDTGSFATETGANTAAVPRIPLCHGKFQCAFATHSLFFHLCIVFVFRTEYVDGAAMSSTQHIRLSSFRFPCDPFSVLGIKKKKKQK